MPTQERTIGRLWRDAVARQHSSPPYLAELHGGWEVSKGEFVIVEDADLEAIDRDSTSRAIEITRFVPAEQVDPIFFDRTYFLVPATAPAQRRPYALLLEAMRETGMAALGSFVLAGKEKLALIRVRDDALVLETLFIAEDVYSAAEIEEAVSETKTKKPEVELAHQVIAGLAGSFEPSELASDYRRDLRALLETKRTGAPPAKPEPTPKATPAADLMDALRQSVAEAKKRKAKAASPATARKRAATPKKAAAKKR